MRKSKLLLIGIVFQFAQTCYAQVIDTRMYPFNYGYLNPAFTSEENRLSVGSGIDQQGKDQLIYGLTSYEGFIGKINTGIGFVGYSDKIGPLAQSSMGVYVNHKFNLTNEWKLNLATKVHRQQEVIDLGGYSPVDPNDPILVAGSEVASNLFADVGVKLQYSNFYGGATAVNVFNSTIELGLGKRYERAYNGLLGANFKLGSAISLDASVFASYKKNNTTADINSIFTINRWIITGASYATNNKEVRVYTGANIKTWGKIVFLVYRSGTSSDFRLDALMQFKL